MFSQKSLSLAVVGCFLTTMVSADDAVTNTGITAPVVVTATRVEQNSFDLPVSIDVVSGETIHDGQAQVNLSETAVRIPGVIVGNRNNYAQDLAVSTRGFGARSAFGVRGVRLYADGIPMSMPDGQGQTGTFNLDTAKRVEFLRGPFSALYGNSSGGVVQIFTADGAKQPTISGGIQFGSNNTNRETLGVSGQAGEVNYIASASRFDTEGYRDHSEAMRNTFHTKLTFTPTDSSRLTMVATSLNQPGTQDPLGLDINQLKKDPSQAGTDAEKYNTRVNRSHAQIGFAYDLDINSSNTVHLMGYYGQRFNTQFQSISPGLQANARHGGGVAEIEREFGGVDARWSYKDTLAGQPFSFTAGLNYDTMTDDRRGYENFIGSVLGVQGKLRRDETDKVFNVDEYAQVTWEPGKDWLLTAGIRHSRVHFDSNDHYINGTNKDDSGTATFSETTPVGGVLFRITPSTNVYFNAGRGFETPTFIEMAYNPTITKAGLNFALRPATSHNYEAGIKSMLGDFARINLAYFKINTDDEIVIANNQNGRAAYQNAGKSERHGIEASVDAELGRGFTFYVAYSWINAEYRDSFETCNKTPCIISSHTGTAVVNSGNKIPGVYRSTGFAELAWKHAPTGFSTALEARANDNAYVDDLNSAKTAGYALVNWRGGFTQNVQGWKISEFVRVDNIFDRNYVSSIRVGDLNGRYYEPGVSCNWLIGLNANYQF